MEYQTLKSLKNQIDLLITEHPEWENIPLIYSVDDEGNAYHKVYSTLTPAQVHDINEWSLEMVGYLDNEDIDEKDVNCIIIN